MESGSANAASRRARSRARAVSVASAPTRITAKERAVGVKSPPLASSLPPSAGVALRIIRILVRVRTRDGLGEGGDARGGDEVGVRGRVGSREEEEEASAASSRAAESAGWDARRRDHARARRARGAEVEGRAPRRSRGDEIRSGVRLGGLRARNGAGERGGRRGGRVPYLADLALARRDLGVGAHLDADGGSVPRGGATDARDRGAPGRGAARGRRYREMRRQGDALGALVLAVEKPWSAWRDSRAPRLTATRERLAS